MAHESLVVSSHSSPALQCKSPALGAVVRVGVEAGLRVCITSNGERGERVLPSCAEAGVDRVNFSIFGTTAEELAQVQDVRFANVRLAQRKIDALRASMKTAIGHGIKASANIVVPSFKHASRVWRLLEEYSHEVSVRLLNSLDDGQGSIDAITQILDDLHARAVAHMSRRECREAVHLSDCRTAG